MQIRQISATFFTTLLNRLGIRPPFDEPFILSNLVQPVSIVDQDLLLSVNASSVVYGTPFSAGMQAAPVINTVLADTGQLAVGTWQFDIWLEVFDGVVNGQIGLQHRDAANAANIWDQQIQHGTTGQGYITRQFSIAKTITLNERVRVICIVAGGAASRYHANIFAKQLS
jgi:hypothetical protein